MRRLEAMQAVAETVAAETDLAGALESVAIRGCETVDARSVLILLREGDDLVIASGAGDTQLQIGARIPIAGSMSGEVMRTKRPAHVDDPSAQLQVSPPQLETGEAPSALLLPLVLLGEALGVLAAFNRGQGWPEFDESDERMLVAFAASAATAVGQHRRSDQID